MASALNILGGAGLVGGLLGSLGQSMPEYNMDAMSKAYELITKQQENINKYFNIANTALESQYKTYYGQSMQAAVDALAKQGIYGSPIAQKQQNRTIQALGDTYANAKSQLAAQQTEAQGSINAQLVNYYQNLANVQFQSGMAQAQGEGQKWGALGMLGGALIGL